MKDYDAYIDPVEEGSIDNYAIKENGINDLSENIDINGMGSYATEDLGRLGRTLERHGYGHSNEIGS